MSSSRHQSPSKRLLSELRNYASDPNPALERLGPVSDDDLLHWTAVMRGAPGTPYEGGRFLLDITVPPTYPLQPPTIKFVTKICHPNVHWGTGEICLDTLKEAWSPAQTISAALTSVQQLMGSGEADSPLNVDVAGLMRLGDKLGVESLCRWYAFRERYEGP